MKLSEAMSQLLVQKRVFENTSEAQSAILSTFKQEFPFWSFADWDMEISAAMAKALVDIYRKNTSITIKDLILDFPRIVNKLHEVM